MSVKSIAFLIFLFIEPYATEKNDQQFTSTTINPPAAKQLGHILNNLDEKLELRLKLTDLELKLKHLEIQNVQTQRTLQELKDLLSSGPHTRQRFPRDCKDVQEKYGNVSDIYRIQPDASSESFLVLCDMKTQGGGWTYVLNRYDGSQDFDLGWKDYRKGFGHLAGEFWLGLEHLRKLATGSSQVNELLIELVDWDMKTVHAKYGYFSIGSENEGYALKLLAGYSGDAGDSFSHHVGKKFSTKDRDQDNDVSGNCASYRFGGWWYDNCFFCKLTGKYLKGNSTSFQGIHWYLFRGNTYSIKQARMMVRPKDKSDPIKFRHEIAPNVA